jgi:ATP-dependent protease ClpP protease subunit
MPQQVKPQNLPKTFEIRAAGESAAELLIYGDIGDNWYDESVTAKEVVQQLQGLEATDITVRINSYGGSVADGLAIYNALRSHKASVTVRIEGVAVSIASLIAMAGDTIEMGENALFMVHAPWGYASGNSQALRDYADTLDKFALAMSASYARKTGIPVDEIMTLLTDGADHWYTAAEAKAAGFVDQITDAVAIAAHGLRDSKFWPSAAARKNHKVTIPAAIVATLSQLKEATMPQATKTPESGAKTEEEIRAAALAADGERRKGIRAAFTPFAAREGVSELLNTCLDDIACSEDDAGKKLLAHLGKNVEPIASGGRVEVVQTEREKFVDACSNALLARMGVAAHDLANPYRGMRMSDMARKSLERAGVGRASAMLPEEFAPMALALGIVRGAQTTSDFPIILENTMHKIVLQGFAAIQPTYTRWCKVGDVTDLRDWNRIVPGLIGDLDDVGEDGEYKNKAIPDGVKNKIRASRKGNIIQITPEVLINDDTGYIVDTANGLGQAAGRAIDRGAYKLLESNPTLSDGVALFHANHGNLAASGAAPTVALLDAAAVAMAGQKAPGADAEPLDISPDIALAHRALRGTLQVIVNSEYDPDTANKLQRPNMVRGIVSDIVSTVRLSSATAWYLFANPSIAPVVEVVFLNGQRAPRLTQEENFRTSGLAWKVEMPFGVGAIDFRGAYKNPGQ